MSINKILIVGDINTHHRSQIFIQKLMHRDVGSSNNFLLSFANPRIYSFSHTYGFFSKVFRKIINALTSTLFIVELIFKIPFCNKIYLLAMNNRKFLTVYIINLIWRKPIVSDLFISIYDMSVDRGFLNTGFFKKLSGLNFAWYLKMIDRLIIERSTKVIYLGGRTELQYLAKAVGADLTKSSFVLIPPASMRKTIATPTDSTIFRLCWWGSYAPSHGVDDILRAAGIMKERGFNFSLNLFGAPQNDSSKYEALAAELGLEQNVFFHTDKTFGNKKLEEYLAKNCDMALGSISHSERAKRVVPTKIPDAFSMKIPVISMDRDVLREYADIENDLFVCSGTPESLAEVIMKIYQDKSEMARRSENSYKLYESKFTPEAVQDSFMNVIKNL